jgi:hypothetical protein
VDNLFDIRGLEILFRKLWGLPIATFGIGFGGFSSELSKAVGQIAA